MPKETASAKTRAGSSKDRSYNDSSSEARQPPANLEDRLREIEKRLDGHVLALHNILHWIRSGPPQCPPDCPFGDHHKHHHAEGSE